MLVSVNWLSQYIDLSDIDPKDLAEKITRTGIEVESVNVLADATNVVIGYVEERVQHPNADKLSVCQVNVGGEDGVVQIVCGAKNERLDKKSSWLNQELFYQETLKLKNQNYAVKNLTECVVH